MCFEFLKKCTVVDASDFEAEPMLARLQILLLAHCNITVHAPDVHVVIHGAMQPIQTWVAKVPTV